MGTYNKNMNRSIQFDKSNLNIPRLATLKTHLYSRSNELNKDLLKDYTIKKENDKVTTYKCNKSGSTIEDDNISLTIRDINNNMSDKDKAKALIDVAKAKGWDISKVEVFGSGPFKVEFEKQLKAELEKRNVNKKELNSFEKLQAMKNKEVDFKELQKNQEKTKNKEEKSFQIER